MNQTKLSLQGYIKTLKKNGKLNDTAILDIVKFYKENNELPFIADNDNWLHDSYCDILKRTGAYNDQYPTPPDSVKKLIELADNFIPDGMKVLNACCGVGLLSQGLMNAGFKVTGFDIDEALVEACSLLYPEGTFYKYDFRDEYTNEKFDLIISNPPAAVKDMLALLAWIPTALTENGKAIIITPKDFFNKKSPKKLVELFGFFNITHTQEIQLNSKLSSLNAEVNIFSFSEKFKEELRNNPESKAILEKLPMTEQDDRVEKIHLIPLTHLSASALNPRKRFDSEALRELADSIHINRLQEPAIIRLNKNEDGYEIVAGERRQKAFIINKDLKRENYFYDDYNSMPCIIREYTDQQVLEIALTENINREDLTPIEEGCAYERLIKEYEYTPKELSAIFGKTEKHIKSRLSLINLVDGLKNLLETNIISINSALELVRYPSGIQQEVYENYFLTDDAANWKHISVTELHNRLDRMYTTELRRFGFDKTECSKCQFNTGTYSMFNDATTGKCNNAECLNAKKTAYTLALCTAQKENKEVDAVFVVSPSDKLDKELEAKLKEFKDDIKVTTYKYFPNRPAKPVRKYYKSDEEFTKASDKYKADLHEYQEEMDRIKIGIDNGQFQRAVHIGDNNPKACYIEILNMPKTGKKDTTQKIKEELDAYKINSTLQMAKELAQKLRTTPFSSVAFPSNEEAKVIYSMLTYLRPVNYPLFGIEEKDQLTKADKDQIMKKLVAANKEKNPLLLSCIKFDFLIFHFCNPKLTEEYKNMIFTVARLLIPKIAEEIDIKWQEKNANKDKEIKARLKKVKEEELAEVS